MATRVQFAPAGVGPFGPRRPSPPVVVPWVTGGSEREWVAPGRTAAGDQAERRRARRGEPTPNRHDAERPGRDRRSGDGRVGPRSGQVPVSPRRSTVQVGGSCLDADVPYRMGRWARLATTVTVAVVFVLAGWSLLAGTGPSVQDVVVQPGDTLVSIATAAQPGADVDAVVLEILELNVLGGAEPLPGQILQVPVQG